MTSTTTPLNWKAIVQELERGIEMNRRNKTHLNCGGSKPMQLRQFFTIGIKGPRQSGKTIWIMRYIAEHPAALVVMANDEMRDQFIQHASTGEFAFSGKLEDYTPVSAEILDRMVITAKELNQLIKDGTVLSAKPSRMIIDESYWVFNNVRIAKYYDWLGKQSDDYIDTIMID